MGADFLQDAVAAAAGVYSSVIARSRRRLVCAESTRPTRSNEIRASLAFVLFAGPAHFAKKAAQVTAS